MQSVSSLIKITSEMISFFLLLPGLQPRPSICSCCWHCWPGESCSCLQRPGKCLPVPHQHLWQHLHDTWVSELIFLIGIHIFSISQYFWLLLNQLHLQHLVTLNRPRNSFFKAKASLVLYSIASRASCVVCAKINTSQNEWSQIQPQIPTGGLPEWKVRRHVQLMLHTISSIFWGFET